MGLVELGRRGAWPDGSADDGCRGGARGRFAFFWTSSCLGTPTVCLLFRLTSLVARGRQWSSSRTASNEAQCLAGIVSVATAATSAAIHTTTATRARPQRSGYGKLEASSSPPVRSAFLATMLHARFGSLRLLHGTGHLIIAKANHQARGSFILLPPPTDVDRRRRRRRRAPLAYSPCARVGRPVHL